MRRDAFGFMWEDKPVEGRSSRSEVVRPIPPIPQNGWKPKPFPRLEKAKILGFDTETKDPELEERGPGVRREGCHIVGISVATEDGHSWYFPMRHELGENLPPENVMRWAQDELTRPGQPKVGTNLLYDLDFMAEAGVQVAGPYYDIGVAEALIDENADGYSLEAIGQRHTGEGKVTSELADWVMEAYGDKNYRKNIYRTPSNVVGPYAEGDAGLPLRVLAKQLPRLRAENLMRLWEVESGLTGILLAMRRRGVRVDLKKAERLDAQLEKSIAQDAIKLKGVAGFDVNVDAKDDLVRLFDALGLKYPRTAPTDRFPDGQPSFVKEFLEHHPHPVAQQIVALRKWKKFRSTFVQGYILNSHIKGRLHCQFHQTKTDDYGTVSGRLSSSDPNLQNIPIRDEFWGPLIRSLFLPELGEDWYRFDWSQVEYRILVHLARHASAEKARAMYRNDPTTDFHLMVAHMTGLDRKPAKNINFGLVYGMGKDEMARQLGVTTEKGEELVNQYHEKLPFVREAYNDASNRASSQGYIETLLHRRRRFNLWQPRYGNDPRIPGLPLEDAVAKWGPRLRRAYTHKGLNGEVQGSAADLMKLLMYEYWKRQDLVSALGAPLLTVHDELDESVPRTKVAREAARELKNLMENLIELTVPIVADMERGKNWGATK